MSSSAYSVTKSTIEFLDAPIIQSLQYLSTNWYQKSTYSRRILKLFSDLRTKNGMFCNLVDEAILLSNEIIHDDNLNYTPLSAYERI